MGAAGGVEPYQRAVVGTFWRHGVVVTSAARVEHGGRRVHNEREMHPRVRSLIRHVALVAAIAVGSNAFADLQAAAKAMACCAKTDYQCAGLRAPDDCCQAMGHIGPGTALANPADSGVVFAPSVAVVPEFIVSPSRSSESAKADAAFKRPHDPPHLHPYSLLI